MIPVYLRLSALTNGHRLACVASMVLDSSLRPAFSKLGRPSEPLCALAALLTGELIGYTYESHWRRARLHLHRREAEVREKAEALRVQKEGLEQLSIAKDNFVASLS